MVNIRLIDGRAAAKLSPSRRARAKAIVGCKSRGCCMNGVRALWVPVWWGKHRIGLLTPKKLLCWSTKTPGCLTTTTMEAWLTNTQSFLSFLAKSALFSPSPLQSLLTLQPEPGEPSPKAPSPSWDRCSGLCSVPTGPEAAFTARCIYGNSDFLKQAPCHVLPLSISAGTSTLHPGARPRGNFDANLHSAG